MDSCGTVAFPPGMDQHRGMSDPIVRRILEESGDTRLLETLMTRVKPSDLKTLLLEVVRARTGRMKPADLVRRWTRDPLVRPSPADGRRLARLRALATQTIPPDFEVLELSPVAPLGSVSALTNLDPSQALPTIGATEVCSDPTNALALECALRRARARRDPDTAADAANLGTCFRCLRPQTTPGPGVMTHFELVALCSAGVDTGAHRFESSAFITHIRYYLDLLREARALDARPASIRVTVTAFTEAAAPWLREVVMAPLARLGAVVAEDPGREAGRNYYHDAAFGVWGKAADGAEYMLADGGLVDWTQRLLGNRKERLVISGLGLERLAQVF